jgi:hypothetical protein
MTRWLGFGLTGPVGTALLAARGPGDAAIDAVSRRSPPPADGVAWQAGDLQHWHAPRDRYDAVLSVGPLDHFSRWYERAGPVAARVVALGSTSVHSKAASPDPAERELAARLAAAEARLEDACRRRGAALTLLRPTLIYGVGRDRNLSRIVGLARRWRVVPLPRGATGLRQPVHAGDVAAAVLAALRVEVARPGRFDLPGGETLAYDEMVRRTLAAAAPRARLVRLPDGAFRAGFRIARLAGRLPDAGEGLLRRLGEDLAYDAAPVRGALGIAPRGFAPEAGMFAD